LLPPAGQGQPSQPDFALWRRARPQSKVSVELKAARRFTLDKLGHRRFQFGGHGRTRSITIWRQLCRSGANVLVLSWPEETVGPAGQPAEELWFLVLKVADLTPAERTELTVKGLKRSRAQLQDVFGRQAVRGSSLKAALAAVLP
jgi:hypothetical protein